MGKTFRHGCDYGEKPNPRIPRADIAGAERAVEENILSSLERAENPLRQPLFLLSLDPEIKTSLHDRFLDDLQSLGEQVIAREVEFVI